jgi:hypothetical protein
VIVSSAVQSASYFTIDHKTLIATPYKIAGTVWQSSDLANSNLLSSGNRPSAITTDVISKNTDVSIGDNKVSIYPNPVTNNQFTIQFNQMDAGNYSIHITDVMGRHVSQRSVSINGDNQSQNIKLNSLVSKGVYLIQVTNANSKAVFSTKIVLQ